MATISKRSREGRPPLRKALGQHHLRRSTACGPLVSFLRPAGELVVEIGSGGGVLTRALLASGPARLIALELDPAWAFGARSSLLGAELVVADALDVAWEALPVGAVVAGNLPYNVATPIIERVLRSPGLARSGFLLQLEVAERIAAAPGSKSYGALTVLVAARAEARLLGRVAPGAFHPPPKVDSAFVGLTSRVPDPRALDPLFAILVRAGFQQRRKTLANALGAVLGKAQARGVLEGAGIRSDERAERVPLAGWLALVDAARIATGARQR